MTNRRAQKEVCQGGIRLSSFLGEKFMFISHEKVEVEKIKVPEIINLCLSDMGIKPSNNSFKRSCDV